MNHTNPQKLRADINKIAALKTDNTHIKALRDKILIGYTYFLEPIAYLECAKTSVAGYDFLVVSNGVKRRIAPMHPLVSELFYKWNDIIQSINSPDPNDLINSLFPDVTRELPNFNDPSIGHPVIQAEGLTSDHMNILLYLVQPPHLQAVFTEHYFAGYTANHDSPECIRSKAALEEFFNNHPFFEHLKIRLNK
jgi:hypothetical protein